MGVIIVSCVINGSANGSCLALSYHRRVEHTLHPVDLDRLAGHASAGVEFVQRLLAVHDHDAKQAVFGDVAAHPVDRAAEAGHGVYSDPAMSGGLGVVHRIKARRDWPFHDDLDHDAPLFYCLSMSLDTITRMTSLVPS